MSELTRLTAERLAAAVRGGELSALEVFDACLARAREVEPRIGAFVDLCEEDGRERAREVDRRRAAGEALGPLAGVPVAVKDNLAVAGRPLACASKVLDGYVSPYSASAVERLEAAGAVLFGRTNLDEFAMGSSCERSAFGPSRNPWHLGRVPGGSSGGSAAAVAAASVPLALGSDTGGSVRQPAAFCGVVGLRPTWGRVSRFGLVAFASSLDQIGPLARRVRDSALALSVIAGPDPRDSTCSTRPAAPYLDAIEEGIDGLRVGIARETEEEGLESSVRAEWRRSLSRLETLGAELCEVSIPNLPAAVACYYVLATSEASANLARFDGVRYGLRAEAETLQELYARSRTEGFGAEVKRRVMLGTFSLSAGYHEAYYRRAQGVRAALRQQLGRAFEKVELLAMPASPSGAFALGERLEDPLSMYLADVFTAPASLAGVPAVAVPSGRDAHGMPLALQLLAPPFDEALALRAAHAFEEAAGWKVEPGLTDAAA